MACNGIAWKGRRTDMRYELRLTKLAKRLECVGFSDALLTDAAMPGRSNLNATAVLKSPQSKRFALAAISVKFGTFLLALSPSSVSISASAETLLFTGATVHTVSGATITNGQVLVRDGKIAAVGENVSVPNARQIYLDGLQLYPGMIALNTDLGLVEIDAVRSTIDVHEVGDYTPDVYSWLAVNPDSELLPVARANGISPISNPCRKER